MKTTLTIKTEKELRDQAKKTADQLGLPLGTVINAMLRQFVRDKEITLSAYVPNKATREAIAEASAEKTERFHSFEEWKKVMEKA